MSAPNRIILAQATLATSKKGKSTFNAYAARVTKANREVSGKEKLAKKK